jgi:pyridoxal phosphate enzyme (YggS family)
MSQTADISLRLSTVRERIRTAALRAGRDPESIRLIAVSKGQPGSAVREAHAAGQRDIGENYLEEAETKFRECPPDIVWHMIGHVQSRKAKGIPLFFSAVHSVDSLALAGRLSRSAVEQGKRLRIFLECNVSGEATKYGWPVVDDAAWPAVIAEWREVLLLPGLTVSGLMTMAPYAPDPEASRPVFRNLRLFRDHACRELGCPILWDLSMGMSDDFEPAIEEGATHLRIGRAIFGDRKPA